MIRDYIRRDGRTFGFVSLTRTLRTSIIQMEEGWIEFNNFPHKVWYNFFPDMYSFKDKEMFYIIGEYEPDKWKLMDYQTIIGV